MNDFRRQSGLSLVEVIVASLILSLIMLATMTAMRTFGRTYDTLLVTTERTARVREVGSFLRLALRDAMNEPQGFRLRRGELVWSTPLDRVGSAGGVQYLKLSHAADELVLSFAPHDAAATSDPNPDWGAVVEDFVLLEAVDRVAFSVRESVESDWQNRFDGDGAASIPVLVSIEISHQGKPWPPIVVNLQASRAR